MKFKFYKRWSIIKQEDLKYFTLGSAKCVAEFRSGRRASWKSAQLEEKNVFLKNENLEGMCGSCLWKVRGRHHNQEFTVSQKWVGFFRYFTNVTVNEKNSLLAASFMMKHKIKEVNVQGIKIIRDLAVKE